MPSENSTDYCTYLVLDGGDRAALWPVGSGGLLRLPLGGLELWTAAV
jgi:hypothetical protein